MPKANVCSLTPNIGEAMNYLSSATVQHQLAHADSDARFIAVILEYACKNAGLMANCSEEDRARILPKIKRLTGGES